MYQQILTGTKAEIDAEFVLWKKKCDHGTVIAENAFEAFEQCSKSCPNIKRLLQILCNLPVTTASAERSFSMLRRLKTCLRSTMSNDRSTGLALLVSSHDITVTPEAVLEQFLRQNRRISKTVESKVEKKVTKFVESTDLMRDMKVHDVCGSE